MSYENQSIHIDKRIFLHAIKAIYSLILTRQGHSCRKLKLCKIKFKFEFKFKMIGISGTGPFPEITPDMSAANSQVEADRRTGDVATYKFWYYVVTTKKISIMRGLDSSIYVVTINSKICPRRLLKALILFCLSDRERCCFHCKVMRGMWMTELTRANQRSRIAVLHSVLAPETEKEITA